MEGGDKYCKICKKTTRFYPTELKSGRELICSECYGYSYKVFDNKSIKIKFEDEKRTMPKLRT